MTKSDFLDILRDRISALPQAEAAKTVVFYSEMIDDRIEDGMNEEDAVAALGSIDAIVKEVCSEIGESDKASPAKRKFGRTEDEAFDDALRLATEHGKVSTSMLQKHLLIGFSTATKIMKRMEQLDCLDEADGFKPRRVLITKERAEEIIKEKTESPVSTSKSTEKKHTAIKLALIILGSPLWIMLIAAAVMLVLGVYAIVLSAMWGIVVSIFATAVMCLVCGPVGVLVSIIHFFGGRLGAGLFYSGVGLLLIGLGLFLIRPATYLARLSARITKWMFVKPISLVRRKKDEE